MDVLYEREGGKEVSAILSEPTNHRKRWGSIFILLFFWCYLFPSFWVDSRELDLKKILLWNPIQSSAVSL